MILRDSQGKNLHPQVLKMSLSWLDSLRIKACDFFHTTPAGVPIAAESSMLNRQLGTLIRVVNRFFNAMVLNGFLIVEVRSASSI